MLRFFLLLAALVLAGCGPSPSQLGFSNQAWNSFSKGRREQILAGYQQVKKAGTHTPIKQTGPDLSVYLADGTAMMPPFTEAYPFETLEFKIRPGQCLPIQLRSIDTQQSVTLRACYDGLVLSLDPSPYRMDGREGTVHFTYSPVWVRGFTYSHVSTTGYVQLHRTMLTVKTIPNSTAAVEDVNKHG